VLRDDEAARQRIAEDLDTTFLVEAGAGSGKTTSLVGRMVALVARGTPVEQVAAVTFTRKAANELRERFELEVERRQRDAGEGTEERARFEEAQHNLDRAFLGTIHSFCGRLLREHPLELALDPNFSEVAEEDWELLEEHYWQEWIERARAKEYEEMRALNAVGIAVPDLRDAFRRLVQFPDVTFTTTEVAAPDVRHVREQLLALLDAATGQMPAEEPEDGWDALMSLVRRLRYQRRVYDWNNRVDFLRVAEQISGSNCKVTQKRWSDTASGKNAAKGLSEAFTGLVQGGLADVLAQWREHRYPIVMRLLQRAAADFAEYRHGTGQLGFQDLLMRTAELLREHDRVRETLGRRWRHLLVDEFQDTDPIQAEVCLLLASDPSEGNDWRLVRPRPGSLFVVGDPKQSIYRFRRADIQVYDFVKHRLAECGAVLALTQNFRSVAPIGQFVNDHFEHVFADEATDVQAPFGPMLTRKPAQPADGVFRYTLRPGRVSKEQIFAMDSAAVASFIAGRIARGERAAGDFLVLTSRKEAIEHHARALAARNVAVSTSGAPLPQERELSELVVVLRAIADPDHGVLVAAALEGLFCGLSPADLWRARSAHMRFSIAHPPGEDMSPVGRALAQLHAWWILSQRFPADVLIDRILDDTGLLAHAASQALGDARAGALLHLVEVLRATSLGGAAAVTDAIERIELLLRTEAPDAPLRPGRTDAVRVMNLHKAKGLEGDVVILADPRERKPFPPRVHIVRTSMDGAVGGIQLTGGDGSSTLVLAQPPGWAAMAVEAQRFEDAEQERLLYVATTRAKHELVVARCEEQLKKGPKVVQSPWCSLDRTQETLGAELVIDIIPATDRRAVSRTLSSVADEIAAARATVAQAAGESLRFVTVTDEVKDTSEIEPGHFRPASGGRGVAWGRAVHRAVEALGRGRRGEALTKYLYAVARQHGLTEPETASLHELVSALAVSETWRRMSAGGAAAFELPVMRAVEQDGAVVVTQGIVDAAVQTPDGWAIVDWKTDAVDDATWERRRLKYERQVATYAELLQALSAVPATGDVVRLRGNN
ncbi:MAG: UvrD-helicase domain-containing protein, partial [Gemmatimonadaceae bacterium]